MKKLFIHHPLFRLLSPVFSGVTVYLLILLINNNVEQLQEQFLGQELYVCIGLSFVIQELARILLLAFKKLPEVMSSLMSLFVQVIASMLLCILVVTITIKIYYKYVLGFSANSEELWLFNSIFCGVTLIYILLHISHQYLYKINTKKLDNELLRKQIVEDDFMQFKKGINPDLLFESFEALIVLIQKHKNKVDDLIDHIAVAYRYILSRKERQLVAVKEELTALKELVSLFNYLPYRKVFINQKIQSDFLIVPGSLLAFVEHIIRSTIIAYDTPLEVILKDTENTLEIIYQHNDKISGGFTTENIKDVQSVYNIYSNKKIILNENQNVRTISIPKLLIK